ncbi:WD40-repeat-containing domain protein [Entophlyctis helioformis]|nr:WD40-repeat-containing domain protein [Entophlyctis helioformis]
MCAAHWPPMHAADSSRQWRDMRAEVRPMDTTATTTHPRLTGPVLGSFKVAKFFTDNTRHISSIDFDAEGLYTITASDDESLRIYDARSGSLKSTVNSKKYGCALARFTHHPSNIVYASTKEDDAIRYMSFHDNKYIRYFKGHKREVVSLDMSPQDDSFLSASLDDTVRFWDLRSPNCQGLMHAKGGQPCVAFDQGGYIFAVGLGSSKIRLYDLKKFDSGPFSVFPISDPLAGPYPPEWTEMAFSNDGKNILISTKSNVLYIVDAFAGHIKHRLVGHGNQSNIAFKGTFTPDGEHVLSGSQDGKIFVWEVASGRHVHTLDWHHEPPKVVAFNPKYMMFASADMNLAFWIPPPLSVAPGTGAAASSAPGGFANSRY